MPLSDDEIHRITRAVIQRLGDRAQDPSGSKADAAERHPVADTVSLGGTATRSRPLAPTPSPPLSPRPEAASSVPDTEQHDSEHQRVIIATFGRNRPGVAAALTGVLAEHNCDIADITQKILQEFFSMIMIVDIGGASVDFNTLREKLREIEARLGVTIVAQHEDVFRAMHRI